MPWRRTRTHQLFAGVTEKPKHLREKVCEALKIASVKRKEGTLREKGKATRRQQKSTSAVRKVNDALSFPATAATRSSCSDLKRLE